MQYNTNTQAGFQSETKLQWKPINQSSYIAKLNSFKNAQATCGQQEQYTMSYAVPQNWSPPYHGGNSYNQLNNTWSVGKADQADGSNYGHKAENSQFLQGSGALPCFKK